MRIYIAHNFAAADYLLDIIKPTLERHGHIVTSRWITPEGKDQTGLAGALMDIEDIDSSDAVLLFTEQFGPTPGRGKYFEYGYAIAKKMPCFLFGSLETCVFYHLPQAIHITSCTQIV